MDKQHLFVIHKHKATSLHYDFRLQVGEVMPSWSVPKGPSLDPNLKRLAIPTTDHPLDYRNFEGVIPEGDYGAGAVMIWDEGYFNPEVDIAGARLEIAEWKNADDVLSEGIKRGDLKFKLYGKKIQGSFTLIRTKGFAGKDSWLLIKHHDKFEKTGYDAKDFDTSARTGRSLEEILNNKS